MFFITTRNTVLLAVQITLLLQTIQGKSFYDFGFDHRLKEPFFGLNGHISSFSQQYPHHHQHQYPQQYQQYPHQHQHQYPQQYQQYPHQHYNDFVKSEETYFHRPDMNQHIFKKPEDYWTNKPDNSFQRPSWNPNTPSTNEKYSDGNNYEVTNKRQTWNPQPFQPTAPPATPVVPAQQATSSQAAQQCLRTCSVTSQYNPICGTNGVTYTNEGRFECAKFCGIEVEIRGYGTCAVLATSTTIVAPTISTTTTTQRPTFGTNPTFVTPPYPFEKPTSEVLPNPPQSTFDEIFGVPPGANGNLPSAVPGILDNSNVSDQPIQPNPLATDIFAVPDVGSTSTHENINVPNFDLLQSIFTTEDPDYAPELDVRQKEEETKRFKHKLGRHH